ncbi:UDP-glucuronosyltransferase-like isoform X2 [Oncorhynchus tshawytscha]|uniref:UDP-glucuronosyltransferase-like isoform X2 n=1 Tax=Oncorhynchus tshawytscha TaxID=74940 RepID=UPI001C3C7AA0|nr:UDP-glucuronosyltransferase-like isoform X2 [Oncorhynchus tshawytscha]
MAGGGVGLRGAAAGLVLSLCLVVSCRAGKLLVIPADGSHWKGMKPLVEELGRRGNQVVVVIPEVSGSLGPSEHTITLTYPVPYTRTQLQTIQRANLDTIMASDTSNDISRMWSYYQTLTVLRNYTRNNCDSLLSNQDMMQTLREQRFDAILTDPFEPLGVIVGALLSLPAIYIHNGLPCGMDFEASQCPSPPSYTPGRFTHFTDHMTLRQRSVNFLWALLRPLACRYLYSDVNVIASEILGRETTIPELMKKASLWLERNDFTFEFPRPLMPNMVMIGGMNFEEPNELPEDLQEFVDESGEDGFVVFTLGSLVSQMPEERAKQFFDAFSRIPQRVVWRYTGVVPENAPANVRVMKWLPQNDLLGHPKVKAFITHGGTHGIYEGICNGVPMVMLPLFGDQGDNVHRMAVRGVGEVLSVFDVTSDKLVEALNKVINDKSYKQKMLQLSTVHKDRPIEPLDLAVFWTEFVMRHGGADHLRPAAHDLNWIQYHSLDVFALLLTIILTVVMVTVKCCKVCFRKCCGMIWTMKMKSE